MKNRIMNFIGRVNYNTDLGTYIWSNNQFGKPELIAMIEGYRGIQEVCTTISEANDFQDEMGKFIADAINEKIERESVKVERILIKDLEMSARLMNRLRVDLYFEQGLGITYLDEVSKYTRSQVSRVRNFGNKSMCELEELMMNFGIKFKGD
jgi:DNA-directed RNA polymerase alpha subunit